jgi:hypothetical protein
MDAITALILTCSLHWDDELVRAIVHKASVDNPYFVGDTVTLTTHDHLATDDAALKIVDDIVNHGGRPAVGLMALPITWATRYGRTTADLFDACINISVGTAVLSEHAAECGPRRRRNGAATDASPRPPRGRALNRQRVCILTKLDDDLGVRGYPDAIMQEITARAQQRRDRHVDSPPASAPLVSPDEQPPRSPDVSAAPTPPPHARAPAPSLPTALRGDGDSAAPAHRSSDKVPRADAPGAARP